ncbi:unnamed protein product [Paramecium octaurelia]|uniref:Uncharacterized protein n=1 Tax=Paramecium octaurelia TaxID=43137 RepID=A0A8S1X4K2_PAROT|nr:unnamed protein product [Paramecium octaurelia]
MKIVNSQIDLQGMSSRGVLNNEYLLEMQGDNLKIQYLGYRFLEKNLQIGLSLEQKSQLIKQLILRGCLKIGQLWQILFDSDDRRNLGAMLKNEIDLVDIFQLEFPNCIMKNAMCWNMRFRMIQYISGNCKEAKLICFVRMSQQINIYLNIQLYQRINALENLILKTCIL